MYSAHMAACTDKTKDLLTGRYSKQDATPGTATQSIATPTLYKHDSGNHTPTSATTPGPSGKAGKKKKAAPVNDDDSEVDSGQPRKRINFGAGRK